MVAKEGIANGLLERSGELAALSSALDAARLGDGRLVVIEGAAGIGKTCLLTACRERAEELDLVALRVRGDELVMESSFAAVRELLWAEVDARPELLDGAAGLAASVFERGGSERVDRDRVAAVLHGLYWLVSDLADRDRSPCWSTMLIGSTRRQRDSWPISRGGSTRCRCFWPSA